jgi:signal transduction histidine kinase
MSPLLPRSIAGRMTLVLTVGMLILTAAVSITVLFSGPGRESHINRVVTLAAVADSLPPVARAALFDAALEAGLVLRVLNQAEAAPPLSPDWFTERVRGQLAQELGPRAIRVLEVGHPESSDTGWPRRLWSSHGPTVARLELREGTRLEVHTHAPWSPGLLVAHIGLPVLVVGVGLTVLASLVARRVTRPLRDLAAAAARLGADVRLTPPLGDRGPIEVLEAARAFNEMHQQIRGLLEERTHMLGALSHDLRTPLTRLRLRAELVPDADEQAKMVRDLDDMEAMIHASLAFARDELCEEPPAAVDVGGVLAKIRDELTEDGQRVELHGPGTALAVGQTLALKRALRNLVENAVTYGGQADIAVRATPTDIVITIDDTGPGLPEEELERVFAPFYRVERSRNRATGGVGLGLTVARMVIQRQGGSIALANRAEGGLRQTVILPSA